MPTKKFTLLTVMLLLFMIVGYVSAQEADVQGANGELIRATLTYDGRERIYHLFVPAGYDAETPTPLVLGFHGAGGNSLEMANFSGFSILAGQTNTLVVYPDAIDDFWRYVPGISEPDYEEIDDVGFVGALLDALIAEYSIDESRVSVVGWSNGGMMAERLRCSMADRLSAVAIIGATMSYNLARVCLGAPALPTMSIIGTQDSNFPQGGTAEVTNGVLISRFSHAQTLRFLASLNGCDVNGTADNVGVQGSQFDVALQIPDNCPADAPVMMYSIIGAGHEYPAQVLIGLPDGSSGNILLAVWDFFAAFSRM
ncbi:MAG: PHB depolymerase family esterase [Aggregatilineales bacterium]